MKRPALSILLLLIASCNNSKEGSVTSSGMSDGAPGIWAEDKTAFPKQISISNDFSEEETQNIEDMMTAWESALSNKVNFFESGSRVSDISNNVNPKSLQDNVMAIYKTTNWPTDFPSSALAVTQIFGKGFNQGSSSAYNVMYHADILVNFEYTFRTGDSGQGYDLQTVVVHELGHFLGLNHSTVSSSQRDTTIMYPSIRAWDNKRTPMQLDINAVAEKYSINLTGSGTASARASTRYRPLNNDPGEDIHVIMELHTNGECVHKLNGRVIGGHSVHLKKY